MSDLDRLAGINDLETAKTFLLAYAKENERLNKRLTEVLAELAEAKGTTRREQLELELVGVKEQLDKLRQQTFGDSSERRPRPSADDKPKPAAKKTGHGPRPQPNLPVKTRLLRLAEEDRVCPRCNGRLEEIKGATEDAELIDMVRQHFLLVKQQRQKYGCGCDVHTTPAPTKHIKGGRYSLRFAVAVAVAKYADHNPLTRLCRMFGRQGLDVDSQTLWDQIEALAQHLVPAYDKLRQHILGADVVGADETWWRLMGGKAKSTKRWWAWSLTNPDAVWHGIDSSRSAKTAAKYLEGFNGTLMVDGYKAYDTMAKHESGIRLAHCWAHARRKFVEAEPNYPQCSEAIELMGQLFELDRETRDPSLLEGDAKLEAEQTRLVKRNAEARPILDRLRAWALEQRGLPKSGLRKAIDYMFRYWDGLTVFLEDAYVPLDNNQTERALRGLVIGRKNHYGSRSKRGTEVAALFYSLIETAKLHDINPADYIHTATIFAIEFGEALLPWEYAALPESA